MRRCGSPWRHSPPRPAATAGAMADGSAPRVTYFERDFDFDEHAAEVEATWDPAVGGGPAPAPSVRLVRAERAVAPRATTRGRRWSAATPPRPPTSSPPRASPLAGTNSTSTTTPATSSRSVATSSPSSPRWRWTPRPPSSNGCGSGSSCVPILRANPRARVLACDFSPAAVRCTARAAARLDLADRLAAFTCDPARENLAAAAAAAAADAGFPADAPIRAACLVFVLSAVPPDALPAFLDSVRRAVSPGGVVFFRDYGVYDLPMLRFAPSARRESRVYARGDGTLARFFLVEEI